MSRLQSKQLYVGPFFRSAYVEGFSFKFVKNSAAVGDQTHRIFFTVPSTFLTPTSKPSIFRELKSCIKQSIFAICGGPGLLHFRSIFWLRHAIDVTAAHAPSKRSEEPAPTKIPWVRDPSGLFWDPASTQQHFDFEMCFTPQRRALFRHLNFQKVLWTRQFFYTFDFETCFAPQRRAIFHLSSGQLQVIARTQCFATFLPFRAPASSFFWFSLFPWLFPPLLFHLSILSEVWLLNFLRIIKITHIMRFWTD